MNSHTEPLILQKGVNEFTYCITYYIFCALRDGTWIKAGVNNGFTVVIYRAAGAYRTISEAFPRQLSLPDSKIGVAGTNRPYIHTCISEVTC